MKAKIGMNKSIHQFLLQGLSCGSNFWTVLVIYCYYNKYYLTVWNLGIAQLGVSSLRILMQFHSACQQELQSPDSLNVAAGSASKLTYSHMWLLAAVLSFWPCGPLARQPECPHDMAANFPSVNCSTFYHLVSEVTHCHSALFSSLDVNDYVQSSFQRRIKLHPLIGGVLKIL